MYTSDLKRWLLFQADCAKARLEQRELLQSAVQDSLVEEVPFINEADKICEEMHSKALKLIGKYNENYFDYSFFVAGFYMRTSIFFLVFFNYLFIVIPFYNFF